MRKELNLLLVAGARPNFMKVAPLIHAIQSRRGRSEGPKIDYRLVHTGQHYDPKMSQVFFNELGIPAPDFNLEVGSGSHAVQTARIMERFEPILLEAFPPPPGSAFSESHPVTWLVVVGDVNSTMACTLVASKLGIRVAHVEAGLRSFDRTMPEEVNRLVTDALADLLLTPSDDASQNLRNEGVPESKIRLVGNIMIDALVCNLELSRKSNVLERLGLPSQKFAYVTLHRPANVDDPSNLGAIMRKLEELGRQMPVVFPMHPRTRKCLSNLQSGNGSSSALHIVEPVGYHDSLCLAERARIVVTDSGGLQEETTYFRTPCLTLRPNTERPITTTVGSNKLTSIDELSADIASILRKQERIGQIPAFWDGKSAERVLDAIGDAA